jgi:hypothetical protein
MARLRCNRDEYEYEEYGCGESLLARTTSYMGGHQWIPG